MKKVLLIGLIVLLVMICFCSCDPGVFSVDRDFLNNVISVELIEYVNPNQKHFASWVPDQFHELVPFNPNNATSVEFLPSEKISDFLDAFSETDILDRYYAYDSPKDVCIRLNCENGNFLIIWGNYLENLHNGYIGEYSSDGTVLSYWGCFSSLYQYEDLVNEYFNYKLE